ncbi:hypothetical protein QYE76_006462 [Lolium multiflorum]|uniref:CCHC-type domain-containing protein n=1 Tax=Lolium multiflorum TaxID=4521 RepID=A0AAD8W284_LOLMU|nr:hypothetical protein QYE76_006462 [Lolium multiflorum]
MSGHAKKLNDLGIVIPNQLGIHRVLQSLPPSYKNFVMNYNMQNMNKELPELFSMLKTAEVEIKKEHQVLMVNKTTSFKKQGKPKEKGNFKKGGKKVDAPPKKPKAGPKPDTVCYYCKGDGHWKRNCPKYLADLKSGQVKKKDLPDSRKAVENKWIFKRKTDADGKLLSIKLYLSRKGSDKFKELTMMSDVGITLRVTDVALPYTVQLEAHEALSEGIAEEHLDNWRRCGNLSAQDRSSARSNHDTGGKTFIDNFIDTIVADPGKPDSVGSYEFTPHNDSSRSNFSDLQGNMEMTFGSVHYNVNAEGILRLLESPTSGSTSPSASSSLDLSAGLTGSTCSPVPSTPRSVSSMSVGSDDPTSSELTSYYCLNCDTRHGLGSSDTPFICNAQYSSGEDSIDSIVQGTTRRTAHHQVYVANNTGNTRREETGTILPFQ